MKKHLIAAAVAGALAVPAMAQVTVYGRIDAGYSTRDSKGTSGAEDKGAGVVFSAHSTSRFGVKGTEDLGGGLKANFLFETQIGEDTNDSESKQSNLPVEDEAFGGRGMWAGVSGGFGEVRLGYQNAFSKDYVAVSSSGGSNVLGDPTLGSGRAKSKTSRAGLLDSRYQGVSYASPSMGGASLKAMYVVDKQDDDNTTAAKADLTGTELALEYKAGPFMGALSAGTYKVNGSTIDAEQFNVTQADSATKHEQKTMVALATYDLGMAKLFYKYGKVEHEQDGGSASTDGEATYNVVGVSAPLGKVTVFLNYATGDYETTTGTTKFDDKGQQLGATYNLSKRTSLYGIYGKTETDISASTKEKETQFALGLVHAF